MNREEFNKKNAKLIFSQKTKDIAIGFANYITNHKLDLQPTGVVGQFIGVNLEYYYTEKLFDEYLKTL